MTSALLTSLDTCNPQTHFICCDADVDRFITSCKASSKGSGAIARYAERTPKAACLVAEESQIGALSCSSSVGIVKRNSFKKVRTKLPPNAASVTTDGSRRIIFSSKSKYPVST